MNLWGRRGPARIRGQQNESEPARAHANPRARTHPCQPARARNNPDKSVEIRTNPSEVKRIRANPAEAAQSKSARIRWNHSPSLSLAAPGGSDFLLVLRLLAWVPQKLLKKEIWQLDLQNGAHLRNETVWHFPGEPPSRRAVVGKACSIKLSEPAVPVFEGLLFARGGPWFFPPPFSVLRRLPAHQVGLVAHPYALDSPDPEKAAAAEMLEAWREESRHVCALCADRAVRSRKPRPASGGLVPQRTRGPSASVALLPGD